MSSKARGLFQAQAAAVTDPAQTKLGFDRRGKAKLIDPETYKIETFARQRAAEQKAAAAAGRRAAQLAEKAAAAAGAHPPTPVYETVPTWQPPKPLLGDGVHMVMHALRSLHRPTVRAAIAKCFFMLGLSSNAQGKWLTVQVATDPLHGSSVLEPCENDETIQLGEICDLGRMSNSEFDEDASDE